MATLYGFGTKGSFGEEVTAGTPVSRTIAVPVLSVDFQAKAAYEATAELIGSGSTRNAHRQVLKTLDTAGTIELLGHYAGGALGMLLKHALGSNATTGSGPYTHTTTLAAALPNGLTVAVERGNSGSDEVHAGCKINRLTISCAAGEVMRVRAELIGMTTASRTGDTPPSLTALTSRFLIKHHHAGTMSFNGVNYTLKSVELTIDNKLARQDYLGSAASGEPVLTAHQEVTLRVTLTGTSNTLQAAYLAQTASDIVLAFTDSPRSLTFTLHNAEISEYADPIGGVGIIEQTVTFRAFGDDTDHGLSVALVNADSSAVAS